MNNPKLGTTGPYLGLFNKKAQGISPPESDIEEFSLRIDIYRNHGYLKPHEADELKRRVSEKPTPHAQEILRRFVARYYY